MEVWRLASAAYAELLDGGGNRRTGGRWNSPGRGVVYTASHLSLALLERLVHLDLDLLPDDLAQVRLDFPDDAGVERVQTEDLPQGWRDDPEQRETRAIGDQWLDGSRTLALAVPSVIVPAESNIVLNPRHPAMADVRVAAVEPFEIDPRLMPEQA